MTCETSSKVHAYHDGELPAAGRAAFEAHLASCAECAERLASRAEARGVVDHFEHAYEGGLLGLFGAQGGAELGGQAAEGWGVAESQGHEGVLVALPHGVTEGGVRRGGVGAGM